MNDTILKPTTSEGVIQFQIPIPQNFVSEFKPEARDLSQIGDQELASRWVSYCIDRLWDLPEIKAIPRYSELYPVSSSVDEIEIDFKRSIDVALKSGLIEPGVATELEETFRSSTSTAVQVLFSNREISEAFWPLHYLEYHDHFLRAGLHYGVISEATFDEVHNQLFALSDLSQVEPEEIRALVASSVDYGQILKRIENVSKNIDGEFIGVYSKSKIESDLRRLADSRGLFLPPGFESARVSSLKLVPIATIRSVNSPEVVIEGLLSLVAVPGRYGRGNVIKTHSLFPGEKAVVTIKTFSKEASTYALTSSVMDSSSIEAEEDLSNEVAYENRFNSENARTSSYSFGASAKASWGWGSAGAKYSKSQTSKSVTKRTVANLQKATQRQANRVSNNRSVNVETSTTNSIESSTESSLVRTIENINVSQPLTFIFKQMNQRYNTLVLLSDARVSIRASIFDAGRVSSLQQFPDMLREYLIDPTKTLDEAELGRFYNQVLNEVRDMSDSEINNQVDFLVADPSIDDAIIPRMKVNPNLQQTVEYSSERVQAGRQTGRDGTYTFDGILLSVGEEILKTEGVFVDCDLSAAPGLDEYSKSLQTEAIAKKELENLRTKMQLADLRKVSALIESISDNDQKAILYEKVLIPMWQSAFQRAADDGDGPEVQN